MGRLGIGSDANPLAWLLTASKVDLPTPKQLGRRLEELQFSGQEPIDDAPDEIRMLFSDSTLAQLMWLRVVLDHTKRTDRFLLAVLAGGLHGNANRDGTTRGLSVPMPNTFAMAPGYVRRYIAHEGLVAPEVDVLDFVRRRAERYSLDQAGYLRGRAWQGDAAETNRWPTGIDKAKLIFTSPPYLEVIRYGKYNWIRLWLIGHDPSQVDDDLFTSASVDRYVDFMSRVIRKMRRRLRPDGYLVLTLGDVNRGDTQVNLAEVVRTRCLEGTDLKDVGVVVDALPEQHKVSRIWKNKPGRATKVDRLLIMSGPEATNLPPLREINWEDAS